MPDELDAFVMTQSPTAERPLLGLTILVVEDSRFACEAMRLLCLRSGGRIRRADSLRSARRHLAVYHPAVAIIDLGLPDGSGTDLICELDQASPRIGAIIGISGDPGGEDQAIAAGADSYLTKPVDRLTVFQQAILALLPMDRHPHGLRLVENDSVAPDKMALHDDLEHISDLLATSADQASSAAYVAQFLTGLARISNDTVLEKAASKLRPIRKAATRSAAIWRALPGWFRNGCRPANRSKALGRAPPARHL